MLYEVDAESALKGELKFSEDDFLIQGPILSFFAGLCWRAQNVEEMINVRQVMKDYFTRFFGEFVDFEKFYPDE